MTETTHPLLDDLRVAAAEEGFTLFGVTSAVSSDGFPNLVRWIDSGFAGEMDYFRNREDAYRHPSGVLEGVRSIIAMAYPYDMSASGEVAAGQGKIARYAWSGIDYHDVIHPKLKRFCKLIVESDSHAKARGVVDTAPLQEREVAELAGIGWRGKNTLLLSKHAGSYFFLACVLTDLELPIDSPHGTSHCGTCTACLDACPTDAFPAAGVLDARRCISYLTIEHRGSIPMDLREGIGDWLFGCDVCQEVCPWNRKPSRGRPAPSDRLDHLDLASLFTIDDDEFRRRFRKTPFWRARRRGILRNAAIVLGNQRRDESIAPLSHGMQDDEPIVRGASAWALGQIGGEPALRVLDDRLSVETDEEVRREISAAKSKC